MGTGNSQGSIGEDSIEWHYSKIKTYFDDLGEAVEHYNCFIGEGLPNVFDNTEAFQVCILLMLASDAMWPAHVSSFD